MLIKQMIKWVSFAAQTKTQEDFLILAKLLAALGFRAGELEDYPHLQIQCFTPTAMVLEITHRKSQRKDPDLELVIADPDSAVEIISKLGLEISDDNSGPEPGQPVRSFNVLLPGGTIVSVTGHRTTVAGEQANAGLQGSLDAKGKSFAIVVSRFNSLITERLLAGTIDGLSRCGASDQKIVRVPGAFEIPSAARTLAETKKYDAIICLGCLIRGDTAHYDVIVNEVTRGIGQSAQETGVPHAFGVLTCDTLEQAIDRAGLKMGNKGFEAALAAIEMANLKQAVTNQGRQKQIPRSARNDKGAKARIAKSVRASASKKRK
jgi:6,7-dimethyl-8-ribityllumazine synthase